MKMTDTCKVCLGKGSVEAPRAVCAILPHDEQVRVLKEIQDTLPRIFVKCWLCDGSGEAQIHY